MMIVNLYKTKIAQQSSGDGPKLTAKEMIKKISEECGIGQRTVSIALSEYRNKGIVTSPNKTKSDR
jgi:DNA-binding transcriptional ArsR family regulator